MDTLAIIQKLKKKRPELKNDPLLAQLEASQVDEEMGEGEDMATMGLEDEAEGDAEMADAADEGASYLDSAGEEGADDFMSGGEEGTDATDEDASASYLDDASDDEEDAPMPPPKKKRRMPRF